LTGFEFNGLVGSGGVFDEFRALLTAELLNA
jgi:hypothetical protein